MSSNLIMPHGVDFPVRTTQSIAETREALPPPSRPVLLPQHQRLIDLSAISPETARQRGYLSARSEWEVDAYGFKGEQKRVPALVIPIRNVRGEVAIYQLRPDDPRRDDKGKVIKYETPKGGRLVIDVPLAARRDLGNPRIPLIITEGARKADAAVSVGACCIALLGVWGWRGKNEHGGKTALPDWHEIALNDRLVYIAFDSDVMTKSSVRCALEGLGRFLTSKGARVRYCDLSADDGTKVGLDDYLVTGGSLDALVAAAAPQLNLAAPQSWQPPILLTEYDVPPFPVELLPEDLGDYVNAVATSTQTPTALPAMMALAVIAAAAQKRVQVQAWAGWDEPVNIYTAVSLLPANRKSAVVRQMIAPLREWERTEAQQLRPVLAAKASDRRIKEGALRRAEQRAANADNPTAGQQAQDEARTLAGQLDAMKLVRPPRLLVDDITPEKLGALMVEHGSSMAIISAEGSIIDIMAGRFSKDGKVPALDLFLRGHSGDDLPVDRLGREGGYLTAPALTLGLAIQPYVLGGLARRPGFRGTGLLARFAFALPESLIGRRHINPGPVPENLRAGYVERIRQIVNLESEADEDDSRCPQTLRLSDDAQRMLMTFLERLEPRQGPGGDLHHIGDWAGKLGGLTLRLAGLCHTWRHVATGVPWAAPVSAEAVRRCVELAEHYLIPHALAAFGEMGADPAIERAQIVIEALARWEEPIFSKRDLHQRLRRRFERPGQLDEPLAVLIEHGYVRSLPPPERDEPRGRKSSDRYEINPRWERPQNPRNTPILASNHDSVNNVDSVYTSHGRNQDDMVGSSLATELGSDDADGLEPMWGDFG